MNKPLRDLPFAILLIAIALPWLLSGFMEPASATSIGAALASMSIYILMAIILIWRPKGLLPAHV